MQWPNLHTLNLGNNLFLGTIPWYWFQGESPLSNLEKLYLDHNYFTGPVPSQWDQLERIRYIVLNDNSLSGEFPGKFSSTLLTTVEIHNNNIRKVNKDICKQSIFRGGGILSVLRTDCGTCSCEFLCSKAHCV